MSFDDFFKYTFDILLLYECDPCTPGCVIKQDLYKSWLNID